MPLCATVVIVTSAGTFLGEMQDLSRPGIRLRLRRNALGLTETGDLRTTVEQLERMLGTTPTLNLDVRDGGLPIEKRVRVTRIALPMDAANTVELGCRFEVPLDPKQVRALGIAGPVERDIAAAEGRKPPRPASTVRVPRPPSKVPPATGIARVADPSVEVRTEGDGPVVPCDFRALISSLAEPRRPAILCHADQFTRAAVRVRMSRHGYEGLSVAEAAVRITQRHGTEQTMKLVVDSLEVWNGTVRLYSVEVPDSRGGEVLLTFAFKDVLSDEETVRMGLVA